MYNRQIPSNKTGESWDISCRPGEMGIIENGACAGMPFDEYIAHDIKGVLGIRVAPSTTFPLLIKLIDANDTLSVQVHPDDKYAARASSDTMTGTTTSVSTSPFNNTSKTQHPSTDDTGKTEMWYILAPPTDGKLIIGLKPGTTAKALQNACKQGTVETLLNRLEVKTGDIINIPAGLVHALTPGTVVAEVQQNSDITYRLYDYNRLGPDGKPRQLHINDAIAVADFDDKIPKATVHGLPIIKGDCTLTYAIANQHFAIIKYELAPRKETPAKSMPITNFVTEASNPMTFCIYTCVEGEAEVIYAGTPHNESTSSPCITLPTGRSIFIPAGLGSYSLRAKNGKPCILLKSFVPDIEQDFIAPLRQHGYTNEEIATKTFISK